MRVRIPLLGGLLLLVVAATAAAEPLVAAVDAIGMTVADVERSTAFYFRDPDGHPLEILQFPPDKGDPKWHRPTDRLFLGIDHTAIVVADTKASLRFYRDRLGLRVVGASENLGPEQERLNNVFGASLRITTLRAAAGPGIELLEYLSPGDGRPIPLDQRPNDLAHWQTRVTTRPGGLADRGAVTLPDSGLGYRMGQLVRDPDRHAVLLTEHGQ